MCLTESSLYFKSSDFEGTYWTLRGTIFLLRAKTGLAFECSELGGRKLRESWRSVEVLGD
jgi:hypothetical protein